jgi:K+-transporting ATPase KdpF subunit
MGVPATGEDAMNGMYWLSGLLALLVFGYLLYALIRAERF